MLLICILFFYTSKMGTSQCSIFFSQSHFPSLCGWTTMFGRAPWLFPILPESYWTHNWYQILFSKIILKLQGYFRILQIWVSNLSVVLPWPSLSAWIDSILLCFMAQSSEDTCSLEDLDSLLLHLVNKSTLEGSNSFRFPSSPSSTKSRLQELHFCAGITPPPHHLTYSKQQIVLLF